MAKKLFSIEVKGKHHKWSFNFYGDTKDLETWRQDGLEINEVINSIPEWAVNMGLTRLWFFFQDLFNFKFKDLFK